MERDLYKEGNFFKAKTPAVHFFFSTQLDP